MTDAHIVLQTGEVLGGTAAGYQPPGGVTTGEFVFNTALSGYQEVITDPSYAGQVIAFTYPHLGNYGTTPEDDESRRPWCRGVVCRDLVETPSNWRAAGPLEAFLIDHQIPAITEVDTRRLTRALRQSGAVPGAFGTADLATLRAAAATAVGTDGCDLVQEVTTSAAYTAGHGPRRVVALDYGIKATMVRQLAARFTVTVLPGHATADDVLTHGPDGVFLSNGPGDPAALAAQVATISDLLGRVPIFGICLGHQLLSTALGATTFKLPFGHHGSNHPVLDTTAGTVAITAQNHNYAVDPKGLTGASVTHVNLNDGVCEGVASEAAQCFSVQFHPEAGPGPHDARPLFERFERLLAGARRVA